MGTGGDETMAMTAAVKDELSRVDVPKPCCRRSEMAALLRFAGGLHIVSGRVVVEAELDTGAVARRLRREIAEVYGYPSEIHVLASGGLRKGSHYIVRVVKDGEALARQTGLLDVRGRPVRGLPPHVVSASMCCAVAAWRGAFMAHGSLTEPGRSCALEVTCPGPESALALVAAAARVTRALEILGDDAPKHLTSAGALRLEHRQASLEELGALADPPLTKDAIAGRIRRLLALADKRARDLGIPDTEAAVTPEMMSVDA